MDQINRNRILIVGGGIAGWLTAAYLAKLLQASSHDGVSISVVESPLVPAVGVGEGTLPSLRLTLARIGVDEAEFMRACGATFKQGILFKQWTQGRSGEGQAYFHPFNSPRQLGGVNLSPYWLAQHGELGAYAAAVTPQAAVCQHRRAPKRLSDPSFSGPMNYAYHFDVNLAANFLRNVAISLGVHHYVGHIDDVRLNPDDEIESVKCDEHGTLEADLFIDCTGFKSLLIEGALGTTFTPTNDVLFCDRALAVPVGYETPDTPIPSNTISTAHAAGWTWDIATRDRRGVGYVYSSRHCSDDEAVQTLGDYVGPAFKLAEPRLVKFRTGYRTHQWHRNCIAVGLSAGFLEPLESTGILMVEAAAHLIADFYPRTGPMTPAARAFNRAMTERYQCAVNFLKLHFCLSNRPATERFWHDNRDPASIPDTLQEMLDMWKHRLPSEHDLLSRHESFRHINYEYVLLGMNALPDTSAAVDAVNLPYSSQAIAEFGRVRSAADRAVEALPDHRSLISNLQFESFGRQQKTGQLA